MNLFWKERKKKEMEKVRSKERERERKKNYRKKKIEGLVIFLKHKEKQAEKVTKCQKIKNKKAKSIFLI